jgi:3-hydroxyisobutyrate dehydrogenase-like beta-hydroxyacid dehydrogenase
MTQRITFIGFGEAATAFVDGWTDVPDIRAYDIKTDDEAQRATLLSRYQEHGVAGRLNVKDAATDADMVFCTVTADQAPVAAQAAARYLKPGALWFDMNSCAPSSKRQAAETIEAAGARYVDVAVMAPVYPQQNLAPLLLAGPHATEAEQLLKALPMSPTVVDGPVGSASSIKMIRSIMMKGMEALTAECVLAAVNAGVDEAVLSSLGKSYPGIDWPFQSAYNLERSLVHGARRAAEMREVAKTVTDLGFPSDMATATVAWQERLGAVERDKELDLEAADYRTIVADITPGLRRKD